jgi:type I restriction enzyme S subunit
LNRSASLIFDAALARASIPIRAAVAFERGRFTHRPRNDPQFFGGQHPWIQIGEIEAADKFIQGWTQTLNDRGLGVSRKYPAGTVLISIAATIGSVGILGFDCCVPDSVVAALPTDDVDGEFVYYYLAYLRSHLEVLAPQSAQKNINLKILESLPFPRVSHDEQRRIVAFLDRIRTQCSTVAGIQTQRSALVHALMPAFVAQAFN